MDSTILRNFLTIAECGSITAASSRLNIAQPSLSQQLLRLEDELETKLFRRTAKGVQTTEAGRIFQEHARNILKDIDRARQDVKGSSDAFRGEVSVALPTSVSLLLGVPLILAVKEAYPQIKLTLEEAMSGHIREWIDAGSVDLAVLFDARDLRHLSVKPLVAERLCLIGRPGAFGPVDARGLAVASLSLNDVADLRLVMPSRRHGLRKFIDTVAPEIGAKVGIEVDSLLHIKALVAGGHGHSILSLAAVFDDLAAGRLSAVRLRDKALTRNVDLARNPTRIVTKASIGVEDILVSLSLAMLAKGFWSPAESELLDD